MEGDGSGDLREGDDSILMLMPDSNTFETRGVSFLKHCSKQWLVAILLGVINPDAHDHHHPPTQTIGAAAVAALREPPHTQIRLT